MILDVLGLTDDESNAYRALLRVPSCSPGELAAALGVAGGQAARLLGRLEQLGLAARSGESPERLAASPPQLALGALLVRQQNALRLAELELGSLEELYRAAVTERATADVIDVVRGADATRQRFEQLQTGARREVLAFVQAPARLVSSGENLAEAAAVARGVSYRVVLEHRMLEDDPDIVGELEAAVAAGEEVRIADRVPVKLLIADRELALVPIGAAAGTVAGPEAGSAVEGALLVRSSGLLEALLALFEQVWQRASRITMSADGWAAGEVPGALDDLDARIVGLLVAGLTDQAVAARLDLSLRTVQRRVRVLMELTGARTRLQLGLRAGRLGWA